MQLKQTFDTISKAYDANRLDYPVQMYRKILQYQPLTKIDSLLEIGIGTGKATEPFIKLGNSITAVEPGKNLLRIAKSNFKKYKNIKYITAPFEKAKLPKNHFTLVYAGQAFHWVNPNKGLKKVNDILNNNGTLAFFWNIHAADKPGPGKDTKKLFIKYGMKPETRHTAKSVITDIKNCKLFTDFKYIEIPWILNYSKAKRVKLVSTYSQVLALKPDKKIALINELKKSLEKYSSPLRIPMITKLALARKK